MKASHLHDAGMAMKDTGGRAGGALGRGISRLRNSPLSITLKWSLAISSVIVAGMGLLGWVLVAQQTNTHLKQMELFGQSMVEQLSRAASEPLMADDNLILEGLVSRLEKSTAVLGVGIYRDGAAVAKAGISPFDPEGDVSWSAIQDVFHKPPHRLKWSWIGDVEEKRDILSFATPIHFQDVIAGHAVVTLDQNILAEGLKKSLQLIAIATLLLIAVTVTVAFLLARRITRPIHDIAVAGELIGRGEIDRLGHSGRQDEIGQIIESFNQLAGSLIEKRHMEAALSRYLSPSVAKSVLATQAPPALGGSHVEGSVLFCDIVGYTQLSETLPPREVAELLNEYFGYLSVAGHSCHGTVDKFIGDCVMVVFGVPDPDSQHGLHAVTCAVLIQEIVAHLNRRREERGELQVYFRIGVNSGTMMAGNLGAPERMQFTVVGDAVNLASRLCTVARPGQIIISEETAREPGVDANAVLTPRSPIVVRGRRRPVTPIVAEALTEIYRQRMQEVLDTILPEGKTPVC